MTKVIPLLLALSLSLGCAGFAGTIKPSTETEEAKVSGVYFGFGQVKGPGGLAGGAISVPGATLISSGLEAAGNLFVSIFGRSPVVNNYITPDPGSTPIEDLIVNTAAP